VFRRTRREPPRVDLTPLIDIIFQLVLFFMVSTTFISAPGFKVDLPRASSDMMVREQDDLQIWMTDEGGIFVDREPVDFEGLIQILGDKARADPSTLVVIKADMEVGHGKVVTLMDLARSAGLNRLAIATDPSAEKGSGNSGATP
jgi:biopolymer transport protein ExbD/biopolymer transport protein TolR